MGTHQRRGLSQGPPRPASPPSPCRPRPAALTMAEQMLVPRRLSPRRLSPRRLPCRLSARSCSVSSSCNSPVRPRGHPTGPPPAPHGLGLLQHPHNHHLGHRSTHHPGYPNTPHLGHRSTHHPRNPQTHFLGCPATHPPHHPITLGAPPRHPGTPPPTTLGTHRLTSSGLPTPTTLGTPIPITPHTPTPTLGTPRLTSSGAPPPTMPAAPSPLPCAPTAAPTWVRVSVLWLECSRRMEFSRVSVSSSSLRARGDALSSSPPTCPVTPRVPPPPPLPASYYFSEMRLVLRLW